MHTMLLSRLVTDDEALVAYVRPFSKADCTVRQVFQY